MTSRLTSHLTPRGARRRRRPVAPSPQAPAPRHLVVASLEEWDEVWRRNQYLVAGLLRADPDLRVLFVAPAIDPLHELRRGFRPRWGGGVHPAGPIDGVRPGQLWFFRPTKLLPRKLDRKADDRLTAAVRRAARRVGLTDPVLWVNDPAAANLLAATGWPALYDITDDWLAADRTPDELARLVADEDLLLARCAEVTVCSDHLVETKGETRPVTLVTNGVDVDRYRSPVPRPADLPDGPVALYLGTVHRDRFDVDALMATARALGSDGTAVIVGPVLDLTSAEYQALKAVGVVPLGRRTWAEVPAYLQHADVLLVPHLVNRFTDSLDPIKLYEYRAVGHPVVATPVAGFRDSTDPRVTVAAADSYPQAVRRALLDPPDAPPGQATGDAAGGGPGDDIPTWEGQVVKMSAVIDRVQRAAIRR